MELRISNLSKTYSNKVQALKDVTLSIPTGMFGLLGPNGAGKSTLMRTIATLQEADQGEITFDGINVLKQKDDVRKILGYLPQEFGVPAKMTARTLLDHFGVLKGIDNKKERQEVVDALLQQTNLYDARNRNVDTFSGGMRQRFGIAQALLGNPRLIIVDEPTAGLDPQERNRFHNLLSEIGEDRVVILSTHIVEDVSDLCHQMAILAAGKIMLAGDPRQCMAKFNDKIWQKTIKKSELATYQGQYKVISTRLYLGEFVIHVYSETSLTDSGFSSGNIDLEDVYFATLNLQN